MGNGRPVARPHAAVDLPRIFSQGLEPVRGGGGGVRDAVRLRVHGLRAGGRAARVLAGLPPLLRVNIREDASGAWLESSIYFSVANAARHSAGVGCGAGEVVRGAVRGDAAPLPGIAAGRGDGLAGGRARAAYRHGAGTAAPAANARVDARRNWRARWGSRARCSWSDSGFIWGSRRLPTCARVRLELGARLLTDTSQSVAEIAEQSGYESEAAFNRAFKRDFGTPPARYRRAVVTPITAVRGGFSRDGGVRGADNAARGGLLPADRKRRICYARGHLGRLRNCGRGVFREVEEARPIFQYA